MGYTDGATVVGTDSAALDILSSDGDLEEAILLKHKTST